MKPFPQQQQKLNNTKSRSHKEQRPTKKNKPWNQKTSLELGDLMAKLEQSDKELKSSEEDRQELKKEVRHNKNENLDNYYVLARATEEKLQQMAYEVETTDKV